MNATNKKQKMESFLFKPRFPLFNNGDSFLSGHSTECIEKSIKLQLLGRKNFFTRFDFQLDRKEKNTDPFFSNLALAYHISIEF